MKIIKTVTALLLLAIFGASYAYANVVRLALVDCSGFRDIGGNVYMSESLPKGAEQKIVSLLGSARQRIAVQYGDPIALPVTVILGGKGEQERYGLNGSPGKFLFTPWGNYLLLDFEQASIDITAHELVHAEIVSRIGYIKRQFEIPTWFDEGAAMQVDFREKYTSQDAIDQIEFARLVSLNKPSKFWSSDRNQNIDNYRKSKAAVAQLFAYGNEDLYTLLDKIRRGEANVITAIAITTSNALQQTSR